MLPKPCNVKRFLAAAALSDVGLVSSDSEGKQEDQREGKKRGGQHELYVRKDKKGGVDIRIQCKTDVLDTGQTTKVCVIQRLFLRSRPLLSLTFPCGFR